MSHEKRKIVAEQRARLVDFQVAGKRPKYIPTRFNEGASTISRINKEKQKLQEDAKKNLSEKRLKKIHSLLDRLDQLVTLWFKALQDKNEKVSKSQLCEQAKKFARMLNVQDFEADAAWFRRWQKGERIKLPEVQRYPYLETEQSFESGVELKEFFQEELEEVFEADMHNYVEELNGLEADLYEVLEVDAEADLKVELDGDSQAEVEVQTDLTVGGQTDLHENLGAVMNIDEFNVELEAEDFETDFVPAASCDNLQTLADNCNYSETENFEVFEYDDDFKAKTAAEFECIDYDVSQSCSPLSNSDALSALRTLQKYLAQNNSALNIDAIETELVRISQETMGHSKSEVQSGEGFKYDVIEIIN